MHLILKVRILISTKHNLFNITCRHVRLNLVFIYNAFKFFRISYFLACDF